MHNGVIAMTQSRGVDKYICSECNGPTLVQEDCFNYLNTARQAAECWYRLDRVAAGSSCK